MKKVLAIISIISVLFLTGCNTNPNMNSDAIKNNENQSQEGVQNTDNTSNVDGNNENVKADDVNENKATISFKYTDLESLEQQNLLPAQPTIGKLYDIGNVKIGTNIYEVKYVVTEFEYPESESNVGVEKKLKFYDGDVEKLELVIDTENWYKDYIKEISIFKDKYLVTVSDDDMGTLKFLKIYDENLNEVKVKYNDNCYDDNGEAKYDMSKFKTMYVDKQYENYYSVNENDITCIHNEYDTMGEEPGIKVTYSVSEVNGDLEVKIIDESTDGFIQGAGRVI